eukprot:CAMPEP_0195064044 /NCGR_PEP_ID=MMETSP0448-20130528/10263_1 /TAXON_ID=66468 /ORGANISM="Heterocapsa triquestra, Strain CCMP 448" /LENGTH=89 /DNA_ID=CAMNT_0040095033 /DNA_START=75 /DNA_END=344 /DNA_ORIENTATION=+
MAVSDSEALRSKNQHLEERVQELEAQLLKQRQAQPSKLSPRKMHPAGQASPCDEAARLRKELGEVKELNDTLMTENFFLQHMLKATKSK